LAPQTVESLVDWLILLESFLFCSTAFAIAGWFRMTIKPRHCPPITKQCSRH